MKTFKLFLLSFVFSASGVFAHGENMPGPHGGEIRMPGNFHTEVVFVNSQELKVYLLDMQFKSPTTLNSKVSVGLNEECKKEVEYFRCSIDESNTENGEISVKAVRDNQKGKVVKYKVKQGSQG